MAEIDKITPRERRALYNRIEWEYKQALRIKDIQKEAFEEGIQWLYENLLKLPKPQIFYCDSPTSKPEIGKQSKKTIRFSVQNILDQYMNDLVKDLEIYYYESCNEIEPYYRGYFTINLLKHEYRKADEIVNRQRKNNINVKEQIKLCAYIDFLLQHGQYDCPDFSCLKKLCFSGVYHVFFWKNVAFAISLPIIRRKYFNLHPRMRPAIEWTRGPKVYYVNWRETPEWVFTQYGTKNLYRRFLREENEDIRASIITVIKERAGNQGLFDFLKAELVDEKEIVHFSGYKEILRLYKSKEKFDFLQDRHGESGQPYCWSEFTCPSTGSIYLLDNSADFTDAIKAAKFLRPDFVPTGLAYRWSHDAC